MICVGICAARHLEDGCGKATCYSRWESSSPQEIGKPHVTEVRRAVRHMSCGGKPHVTEVRRAVRHMSCGGKPHVTEVRRAARHEC
jgi:hypothetical protein